jgi:hypothetical protein
MKSIQSQLLTITLAGLLSAASTAALAQSMTEGSPGSAAGASSFKSFDSNGDGKVSLEEFKMQGGQEQTFSTIDTDQDKNLNSEEFAKLDKPSSKPY